MAEQVAVTEALTLVDVQDFASSGLGVGQIAVRAFTLADGSVMVCTFARVPSKTARASKITTAHEQDARQGDSSRYTGSIRLANLDATDGLVKIDGDTLKIGTSVALQDASPAGVAASRRAARNAAVRQARAAGQRILESAQAAIAPIPPSKPTKAQLKVAFAKGELTMDELTARYAEASE